MQQIQVLSSSSIKDYLTLDKIKQEPEWPANR